MSQNMWRNIRIEHNLSIKDVAEEIGCTRQMVSYMELGRRKKSLEYQIFILELRGFEEDIINANYLKEILNENKRIEKRTL